MSQNRRGFTLIEVMIIVLVVGILAAIAIPNFVAMQHNVLKEEARAELLDIAEGAQAVHEAIQVWPREWKHNGIRVDDRRSPHFRYAQDTSRNREMFIAHAVGVNSDGSTNKRMVTIMIAAGKEPVIAYQGF